MSEVDPALVRSAFYGAQAKRPYKAVPSLIEAATPPGGSWNATRDDDDRLVVMWGGREVARITYSGLEADEIAMACRALPVMDAALRAIISLASEPLGDPLIRDLATSVIAYVEQPAPPSQVPDDNEEEDDESEERYPTDYYRDDDPIAF